MILQFNFSLKIILLTFYFFKMKFLIKFNRISNVVQIFFLFFFFFFFFFNNLIMEKFIKLVQRHFTISSSVDRLSIKWCSFVV